MTDSQARAGGQAELSRKMTQLRQAYLKRMAATLVNVRRLDALFEGGFYPPGDLQLLYRVSHDYAGSGATFGFPEISTTAKALHNGLKEFMAGDQGAIAARSRVREKLRAFEAACRIAVETPPPEASAAAEAPLPGTVPKLIGVIAGRGGDADVFAAHLRHYGYRTELFGDKPAQWPVERPQAIIAFGRVPPAAARLSESRIPLIVIGGEDKFDARLNAVRTGVDAYFTGDPDMLKIIEKIETLSASASETATYSVLIVDDDEILTQLYEHALRQAGMKTTTVSNARDCLKVMAAQGFDLILMDYAMPNCDGQELATIIRQHDSYVSLPIVFMSAKPDIEHLLIDRGLGIDAYLVKPFSPEQLVSVVRSRARRGAELRTLMMRDSFTGLLNHASFIEALTTEYHAMRRSGREVCYAMIDIDRFKSINDTYGHAAGDTVIKSLARLLKYQLRRSDIVGRCGGEEFGIIMPDCNLENARRILDNLLAKFRDLVFEFDNGERKVTFSGGLALLGERPLDETLAATDKALYRAKEDGRNRIVIVPDQPKK